MLNDTNVHSYQRWQEVEAVAGNGLHVVRDFLEAKMKIWPANIGEIGTEHPQPTG